MDCTCSQLCVQMYLLQGEINIRKLQMSPSLYWEYIHVVSQCCCGHYTRDCAAPERSIHVLWKVRMLQYIHYLRISIRTYVCVSVLKLLFCKLTHLNIYRYAYICVYIGQLHIYIIIM